MLNQLWNLPGYPSLKIFQYEEIMKNVQRDQEALQKHFDIRSLGQILGSGWSEEFSSTSCIHINTKVCQNAMSF